MWLFLCLQKCPPPNQNNEISKVDTKFCIIQESIKKIVVYKYYDKEFKGLSMLIIGRDIVKPFCRLVLNE